MASKTLTFALAAAALTVGTTAEAAAPARTASPAVQSEGLAGGSDLLPVLVFVAAILAVFIFGDDDAERPQSP
jgi:hypothetical protein